MSPSLFALNKQPLEFIGNGYFYDGRPIPRVTNILNVLSKDFRLPWALKEMEGYINTNWEADKPYTTEEKEKIVHRGKSAFDDISFKAMGRGTKVHKWIQAHINRENPPMPSNPEINELVQKFLTWEKSTDVKWLASELTIASPTHWFAGTIDFIAIINDEIVLGDFKAASKISTTYFLQTIAYLIALEELIKESFYNFTPGNIMTLGPAEKMTIDEINSLNVLINYAALEQPVEVHKRMIIQIPPEGEVNPLVVPTDPEKDCQGFFDAYGMYRWVQHCEERYAMS